jgi:hypothetical protein
MIGRPGKWPWKNCSLKLTALIATISSPTTRLFTRSTSSSG